MDSIQEGFQHCTRMEQSMPFEHHQMIANFSFKSQNFQIVRQCIDHFTETNSDNGANNFLMPAVENNGNSISSVKQTCSGVEACCIMVSTHFLLTINL